MHAPVMEQIELFPWRMAYLTHMDEKGEALSPYMAFLKMALRDREWVIKEGIWLLASRKAVYRIRMEIYHFLFPSSRPSEERLGKPPFDAE